MDSSLILNGLLDVRMEVWNIALILSLELSISDNSVEMSSMEICEMYDPDLTDKSATNGDKSMFKNSDIGRVLKLIKLVIVGGSNSDVMYLIVFKGYL